MARHQFRQVETRQFRVESPRTARSQHSAVVADPPLTEDFEPRDLNEAQAPLEELGT